MIQIPPSTHRQRRTPPAAAIRTAPTCDHPSCLPHFLLCFLLLIYFVLTSQHSLQFMSTFSLVSSFVVTYWAFTCYVAPFLFYINITSVNVEHFCPYVLTPSPQLPLFPLVYVSDTPKCQLLPKMTEGLQDEQMAERVTRMSFPQMNYFLTQTQVHGDAISLRR